MTPALIPKGVVCAAILAFGAAFQDRSAADATALCHWKRVLRDMTEYAVIYGRVPSPRLELLSIEGTVDSGGRAACERNKDIGGWTYTFREGKSGRLYEIWHCHPLDSRGRPTRLATGLRGADPKKGFQEMVPLSGTFIDSSRAMESFHKAGGTAFTKATMRLRASSKGPSLWQLRSGESWESVDARSGKFLGR